MMMKARSVLTDLNIRTGSLCVLISTSELITTIRGRSYEPGDFCHENISLAEKILFNFKTSSVSIYSEYYFELYFKQVCKSQTWKKRVSPVKRACPTRMKSALQLAYSIYWSLYVNWMAKLLRIRLGKEIIYSFRPIRFFLFESTSNILSLLTV